MKALSWQRLDHLYFLDDTLVLACDELGMLADTVFVRLLAFGKPIEVPEGAEGRIIGRCLGIPPDHHDDVARIVAWYLDHGTITRTRRRGPSPKGTPKNSLYDLSNRSKYRPPNRELTPSERETNSSKQQVEDASDRDARVTTNVTEDVTTNVRTDERDGREGGAAPPDLHPSIEKYLGQLRERSAIFDNVTSAWLIEIGTERGFSQLDLVEELERMVRWWDRAPASKRRKRDGRRTLSNWLANTRKWSKVDESEPVAEEPDPISRRRARLAERLVRALRERGHGEQAEEMARKTLLVFPEGDVDFTVRIAERRYGDPEVVAAAEAAALRNDLDLVGSTLETADKVKEEARA